MLPKPTVAPVNMAAIDHRETEKALTRRAPMRSVSEPHGIRQTMYVHMKAEKITPMVAGFHWYCLAITGAATDRLIRSM